VMTVRDLDFQYGASFQVLRGIAFDALPGECLAVLGNNGAGKSTMLKCLNRILSPQKGTVYIDGGKNILRLPHHHIARSMAFVEQGAPQSRLTVYDMVMLGRKPYIKWGVGKEDIKIVEDVIEQMSLGEMAVRYVDELSGGEQQKVVLARALAQQPRVLLLDEPTSNLDLRNQHEMLSLVTQSCRKNGISAVIVIHDVNLALRHCEKFMLVKDNHIFAHGGKDVITSESIEAVYQIAVGIHEISGKMVVVPH